MKKKIIYISGADIFNVSDVKAAFEEVRATLKLDQDVLLFGVPVDEFESVADTDTATTTDSVAMEARDPVPEDVVAKEVIEPEEIKEIPVKKPRKSKKKAEQESPAVEEVPAEIIESSDDDTSILSVLASNQPVIEEETEEIEDEVEDIVDEEETEPVQDESETEEVAEEAFDETYEEIVKETTEEIAEDVDDTAVEDEQEIGDMLSDDMPAEASEKTLEELLESMAPLREDIHDDMPKAKKQDDEIDATLEHLASEFAENQDKVPSVKKGTERGKIGKLKNILPFKKIKRDDSGIMGDLFGWAGIAANDEDFTIPGFFTNAASKK